MFSTFHTFGFIFGALWNQSDGSENFRIPLHAVTGAVGQMSSALHPCDIPDVGHFKQNFQFLESPV